MPFETAYPQTQKFEGGYSFKKSDRGKETFRGISRPNNPDWPGWPLVDNAKITVGKTAKAIDRFFNNDEHMAELVKTRYQTHYWDKTPAGLPDRIRQKTYDIHVNAGYKNAARILQQALGVKVDGIIGPQTLGAANTQAEDTVLAKMCEFQAKYYKKLAEEDPTQLVNLDGWLRRAKWIPTKVK